MKTRIIAGSVFVVVLAVTFFLTPVAVTAVTMGVMVVMASHELLYTTGLVRNVRLNVYSALMAVFVTMWSYLGSSQAVMLLGVLVYFMLLGSQLLLSSGKEPVAHIGYCLLSGLVVPLLLTSLLRIRSWEHGGLYLLIPFIMAYCSDTGAYFIGVTLGRHKMCPNISPKKSWEGFFGGIVIAAAGLMLYGLLMQRIGGYKVRYGLAVVYGLAGALGSVFGDLSMSVIKRQTGIKDYGKLIPGHGGILDRFDSVLITAPLTEALLLIIPFVE